jgi:hypothetical protein
MKSRSDTSDTSLIWTKLHNAICSLISTFVVDEDSGTSLVLVGLEHAFGHKAQARPQISTGHEVSNLVYVIA